MSMRAFRYLGTLVLTGGLLLTGFGLAPSFTSVGPTAAQAAERLERHPHIRKAIHELKEAKKELEKADHDFGGHRKEALKATEHAIKQLEKALDSDKN
jgi:hypothetical protein